MALSSALMASREARRASRWAKRSSREEAGLSVFGGIVGTDCLDVSKVRERAFLSFRLGGDGMYGRIGPLIKRSGV